jgi:putative transposase
MKLDTNLHSVFKLTYHLVLVVKYRRKVINEQIAERIREIGEYIAPNYNITFLEFNHDRDHVQHFSVPIPTVPCPDTSTLLKAPRSDWLKSSFRKLGNTSGKSISGPVVFAS